MTRTAILIFILILVLIPAQARAQLAGNQSIVTSPHNLSASGPGTVKAANETEICIFCHTPHNATPVQPLWNRSMPLNAYKPYSSNSLKSRPGQPTGNSKLCLSCHDGTIALGSVNSRQQPIQMAAGIITIPANRPSHLGTDLSDDHPISFQYNDQLVVDNPKLKSPALLSSKIKLDANKELQCTTCHDAHNNQYGKFLVSPNTNSELCNTCHKMGSTEILQHASCNSCHQTHSAPSGPYLLKQAKVSPTCISCHNATPGPNSGPNIASLLAQPYRHDTSPAVNLANHIPDNSDCKDCHEPHTMGLPAAANAVSAPTLQPTMGKIDGVSIAGAAVVTAQYEYEVCFKCHADKPATITGGAIQVSRQIVQPNFRLKFAATAVSFHPVAVKGKNTNVPSLRPPLTNESMIYCTDCHGSDSSKKAGSSGPNGPHGSSYRAILVARYETADQTPYSTGAYALCFKCHDNTKVVADTGPFPLHKRHVQEESTPCSTCHDSHGIASVQGSALHNAALINFDTAIVFPDDVSNKIQFTHTGQGTGTCTLKCHNKNHNNAPYEQTAAPVAAPRRRPIR